MAKFNWILTVIACWISPHLKAEGDPKPQTISLSDAKALAIEHNPDLKASKSQYDEFKARLGIREAVLYPRIGVAAGTNTQAIDGNKENEPIAYAYASYNIFNGFQDSRSIAIAKLEAEKVSIVYERIKHRVETDIEQSFNSFLFAKEAILLRTKALDTNRSLGDTAIRRRRAGAASEADVIEFELRESILRSELVALEQDQEDARLALSKSIGQDVPVSYEPEGALEHQHIKGELSYYLDKLRSNGFEVQESKKNLTISEKMSSEWQAGWLPKVDLEARSGKLELRDIPADAKRTTEFLLLAKMDLFSGLESTYLRKQGIAQKITAEQQHRAILSRSEAELRRHYARILTIQKSVDLEDKNGERASQYYQTVLREYNAGVKNSIDLKTAAELVSETSLKRLRYRHTFLSERIEMERLLGSPVDVEIVKESL